MASNKEKEYSSSTRALTVLHAIIETFPVARAYLSSAPDAPNQFDLVCKVNHRFYGLSNFIMGNYRSIVAIYEPESLIDYIRRESEALIQKKF